MTVGIVGLGLIGGSIGLALREPGRKIVGYDPFAAATKTAKDRFCIDEAQDLEFVAKSDVVFVAVPPNVVVETMQKLLANKDPHTVLTDCTSVKTEVVAWATKAADPNIVIGHPMAGHEKSGAAFASAWMFRGAKWIVSPLAKTSNSAVRQVEALIKAMGAIPVRMAPEEHDRQVAVLSHLPHALAGILVQMRQEFGEGDVSGGSWKDLTRVGGVDPTLWTQIFSTNRVELSKALGEVERDLAQLRSSLDAADEAAVHAFFERAQRAKKL